MSIHSSVLYTSQTMADDDDDNDDPFDPFLLFYYTNEKNSKKENISFGIDILT